MSTVEQFDQALEDPRLLRRVAGGAVVAGILATGFAIATAEPASAHELATDGKLIVQENDSLWSLIDKHTDVPDGEIPGAIEHVKAHNELGPNPVIQPGDHLDINFLDEDQNVILVKPNDSLWGLIDANTEIPESEIPEAIERVVEAENLGPNPVIYANQTLDLSVLNASQPIPLLAPISDQAPVASGIPQNERDKLAKGLEHMANVQKMIDAANAQRLPVQREALAQAILVNPKISIASDEGPRVRQSIEDITDDGSTFTHDTSRNNIDEVPVSPALLQMILETSKVIDIQITSLSTGNHVATSNHFEGEGVDLALGKDPQALFKHLYDNREKYKIDELIIDNPPEGTTNLKHGQAFGYGQDVLDNHDDHIHVSVQGQQEINQPPVPTLEAIMAPLIEAEAKKETLANTESLARPPYSIETNPLNKSGVTAEQLDAFFQEHAPAYNGLGKYFIQVEETRGINAIYNVSHTFNESSRGTSEYARTKNNLYGRNVYDTNPDAGITNSGFAAAIIEYGDFLKNDYLTEPGGPAVPGQRDTPGIWFRGFTIQGIFDMYSTQPGHDQMIVDLMNEIDPQIRAK